MPAWAVLYSASEGWSLLSPEVPTFLGPAKTYPGSIWSASQRIFAEALCRTGSRLEYPIRRTRLLDLAGITNLKVLQLHVLPSSCASPPSLHGMTAFHDKAVA